MYKIVVVEDESMVRKGIILTIDWSALDCVVVGEAADGLQALKAVERYDPSLIITDLKMPNMDGIQMMEALRARGSRAYVIILTAYDSFTYARSALRLSHEIIGDLNHGMTAFYDWNLLLDEQGGPNHVGNFCLAPFLYDTKSHTLLPQLIQRHFAHFSAYLLPGSQRVGYSKYTDELDVTAWKRPDGALAAVLLNRSEETRPVCLRLVGETVQFQLPAGAIATGLIR